MFNFRSTCLFPLKFTKIAVVINTPGYSSEFAVGNTTKSSDDKLLFNSNEVKGFLIEFMPDPNDVGKELQVNFGL